MIGNPHAQPVTLRDVERLPSERRIEAAVARCPDHGEARGCNLRGARIVELRERRAAPEGQQEWLRGQSNRRRTGARARATDEHRTGASRRKRGGEPPRAAIGSLEIVMPTAQSDVSTSKLRNGATSERRCGSIGGPTGGTQWARPRLVGDLQAARGAVVGVGLVAAGGVRGADEGRLRAV